VKVAKRIEEFFKNCLFHSQDIVLHHIACFWHPMKNILHRGDDNFEQQKFKVF